MTWNRHVFRAFAAALFSAPLPMLLLAFAALPFAGGEPLSLREVALGLFTAYGVMLVYGAGAILAFGILAAAYLEQRRAVGLVPHLFVGILVAAIVGLLASGPAFVLLGVPCGLAGAVAYWLVRRKDLPA